MVVSVACVVDVGTGVPSRPGNRLLSGHGTSSKGIYGMITDGNHTVVMKPQALDDLRPVHPNGQAFYMGNPIPAVEPQKFDTAKVRVELLPTDALYEIGKVLTFGAQKYAAGNWATGSGFAWSRLLGGLWRHTFAWARGEDNDPESGISHLAHAGCMLLFLLSHVLRKKGTDDRQTIGQIG